MNELYNIISMNPPVMTVKLTGEELREMLEENLERTLARDPYGQMGGYLKRTAGVKLYAKAENPSRRRVQELYVGDERVTPGARYQAAFVSEQGVPGQYGAQREDTRVRAVAAMKHALARQEPVEAELTGSVVLMQLATAGSCPAVATTPGYNAALEPLASSGEWVVENGSCCGRH